MVIRPSQAEELQQVAVDRFYDSMVEHLQRNFPYHCRLWGSTTTLTIVRFAAEKAEGYGFRAEREICLFLTILPLLGAYFDEDPLLPWAGSVLRDPSIRESVVRIERLVGRVEDHLDMCWGKDDANLRRWAAGMRRDWKRIFPAACRMEPHVGMVFLLQGSFPEKYSLIPELTISELVSEGTRMAHSYGMNSPVGALICQAMMFLLGWKFDHDPQLPMLSSILQESNSSDPEVTSEVIVTKERRLFDRLIALAVPVMAGNGERNGV